MDARELGGIGEIDDYWVLSAQYSVMNLPKLRVRCKIFISCGEERAGPRIGPGLERFCEGREEER